MTSNLQVGLFVKGVTADSQDVQVVAKLPHPLSKTIKQHAFKNVNSYLNTNIYSYLETSGGQSYNPYLNVHFLITSVD